MQKVGTIMEELRRCRTNAIAGRKRLTEVVDNFVQKLHRVAAQAA